MQRHPHPKRVRVVKTQVIALAVPMTLYDFYARQINGVSNRIEISLIN